MANAIAKKETSQVAIVPEQQAPSQNVLASDLIIPKVLLMQGLSELVTARKAQLGDMVRSTTGEKLGDPEHPIRFIPLKMTSEWIVQEKIGKKYEYRRTEPRTAANENAPWEFKQDGTEWKRTKVINVYALLPQDIANFQAEIKRLQASGEMPDLNKTLLPVVIPFRSTSFNAGRSVATFFSKVAEMAQYGQAKSFGYTMALSCYEDKNDQGAYYVYEAGDIKPLDKVMHAEAERWSNTLNQMQTIRIDETDDETGPAPSTKAADKF